ncbi:hypothetical protein SPRG_14285 [Saprolegnia parasitica CBS 223.65]|uniref:Uncharacterized protein n=1 Tax=Saprolegnia parasitica (strain CBS 223.65) TaxID=695850 RepID=A0A067C1T3_SAPPC|nr:hypothetical protein SPRG_14285 [Saprolegnia parasitica CBS 223.65]KDO20526.1 hypothetical protein SPRG_14285 [Saprolegnia parasitica CBS 223.65]|eukprot:XP_012208787.1 hypothetical protein SPRG_14285 [Saprolegnia parasitica CBS 223.65]
MDVVEHNLALRELWKRKGEYGLPFVLDEILTLRQLGLVSEDEYMRLTRQAPASTPAKSLPDELQAALEARISALLDAQTYFPLDQIQAALESEFQTSLASHKEWLQHTIFRQSKVKLQKINHAATLARASASASVLQAAYRRHRVSFLNSARARRKAALEAANAVARRAIDNYALDVIGRFLLRRVQRQRFRMALRRWRDDASWAATAETLRRTRAARILARQLPTMVHEYRKRQALHSHRQEQQRAAASRIQARVRWRLQQARRTRAQQQIARLCLRFWQQRQLSRAKSVMGTWLLSCILRRRYRCRLRRRAASARLLQRWLHRKLLQRRSVRTIDCLCNWLRTLQQTRRLCGYARVRRRFALEVRSARVLQATYRSHVQRRQRRSAAAAVLQCLVRRWQQRRAARLACLLLQITRRVKLRRAQVAARRERAAKTLQCGVRHLLHRRQLQRERALQVVRRFCRRVLALRRAEAARRKLSSGLVPMRPRTKKPHTLPAVTRNAVAAPALPPVKLIKRYDRICSTCASPHHTQCRRPSLSSPMKSWIAVPTLYPTKPPRPSRPSNQEPSTERIQPSKPSTVHLPALRRGVPMMKRAVSQL